VFSTLSFALVNRLDISRDSGGHIVYDGDTPKSRGASPAWSTDDFPKLTWCFGPALHDSGSSGDGKAL
jgi:hypothetical protein